MGGDYTRAWIPGNVFSWRSSVQQSSTGYGFEPFGVESLSSRTYSIVRDVRQTLGKLNRNSWLQYFNNILKTVEVWRQAQREGFQPGKASWIFFPGDFIWWWMFHASGSGLQCSSSVCLVPCVHACWVTSVVSNSLQPHGLQPARLLCSWGFSRQEYCSGLPCPPPGDLPNLGIKPRSPALQAVSLLSEPPGKSKNTGVGSPSLLQGISRLRNQTGVSCIAGRFFTSWATREAHLVP